MVLMRAGAEAVWILSVVVVTREENKLLKDDPRRDPDQRYRDAGIEVLERTESGEWEPRRPQNHISD